MGEVRQQGEMRAELNPAHHGDEWREGGERKQYRVTDQVVRDEAYESLRSDGLHKNGRIYKPGELIELNVASAQAALANGDIEEVDE